MKLRRATKSSESTIDQERESVAQLSNDGLVAGYRVLRRIASGDRVDILLAIAEPLEAECDERPAHRAAPHEAAGQIALRIYRDGTDPAAISREITAMTRLPAGHLPELVDVAMLSDGRTCLAVSRLHESFAELLRHRIPEIGEVITVLVPVAATLATLHSAGFAVSALTVADILFDDRGKPIIAGLGGLITLENSSVRTSMKNNRDHIRDSYLALAELMTTISAEIAEQQDYALAQDGERLEEIARWVRAEWRRPGIPDLAEELERRIFALGEPCPVFRPATELSGTPDYTHTDRHMNNPNLDNHSDADRELCRCRAADKESHATSNTSTSRRGVQKTTEPKARRRLIGLNSLLRAERTTESPGTTNTQGRSTSDEAEEGRLGVGRRGSRKWLQTHRRPALFAACAAVALSGVAILLVPSEKPTPNSAPSPKSTQLGVTAAAQSPSESTLPESGSGGTGTTAPSADDPIAAVAQLLSAREECFTRGDENCFDRVDHADSAVALADRETLAAIHRGTTRTPPTWLAWPHREVRSMGDAVLVELRSSSGAAQSVSLLIIHGAKGWRLREIFEKA